jgi:hypothetical protein
VIERSAGLAVDCRENLYRRPIATDSRITMSIFTRFSSVAAVLAVMAAVGTTTATPAMAKNNNAAILEQADRNQDGRISAKEWKWAKKHGFDSDRRTKGWAQTNDGRWVRTDSGRNGWAQTNDGRWVRTDSGRDGWEQTNDGRWVRDGDEWIRGENGPSSRK